MAKRVEAKRSDRELPHAKLAGVKVARAAAKVETLIAKIRTWHNLPLEAGRALVDLREGVGRLRAAQRQLDAIDDHYRPFAAGVR